MDNNVLVPFQHFKDMKLSKVQKKVSDDTNRFRILAAGRRFGKSYLAMNEMAKFARFPEQRILAVAPTYKQCKNIWWNDLKGMMIEKNWAKKINESELQITLVNSSTITLRSSENYDALRGAKYNFIVLDECADMKPDVWFSVLRPTLSDTGGHALFISSPKGRNWFYELWCEGEKANYSSYQFTTLDGGFVPQEEVEQAQQDLDSRTFEQEYEAQFVSYAGVIYYAFAEQNIKAYPGPITKDDVLHVGCDFNIDPMSATIAIVKNGIGWVIDEIEIYGSNTNELVQEIKARYPQNRIVAYPDSSGIKRTTNSGISDHQILQNAGFKLMVQPGNPPVIDRIASVNAAFEHNKLFIDPKCRSLKNCLIKHTYREGTRQPTKDQGLDHLNDSLGYFVYQHFAIKNTSTKKLKPLTRRL
tara:strand:+ start:719 stop:1966 length:1248 start_codon:yes stop_codon:yes gene_type:complete